MKGKYLPIGSIVSITGKNQNIMIVGYYSIKYNNVVKMYDYMGCVYPEGLLDASKICSFNHSDIEKVIFEGYVDENYNVLNKNMLTQLTNKDVETLKQNVNMSNIKYNDNGVVLYDELLEFKLDPEINKLLDSLEVKNPFVKKNEIKPSSDKSVEVVNKDSNDNIDNDTNLYHYQFNEDGITIEE